MKPCRVAPVTVGVMSLLLTCLLTGMASADTTGVGPAEVAALAARIQVSRWALEGFGALLLIVAVIRYQRVLQGLRNYFSEPGPAVNLAVFRLFVFGTILWFLQTELNGETLRWFATLPEDLRFPPQWFARVIDLVPISEHGLALAHPLTVLALSLAFLGVGTRVTTPIAALLSFYLLGVPQVFGKVSHYHHLVWFAALLAVSPCGDVLSVDALVRGWRKGAVPEGARAPVGMAYSLPLRLSFILLGLLYFFPGFWKYWNCGIDWGSSDNLRYQLYHKWLELSGWTPAFRIDHYPWLYRIAGVGTLLFEMGFIGLIWSRRGRMVALGSGLAFHNGTNLMMRINFTVLQLMYSAFVDWQWVLARLGRLLFPADMVVLYDGNCGICRRVIGMMQQLDLFGRVQFLIAQDRAAFPVGPAREIAPERLFEDMHAVCGTQVSAGYLAYREMAWRIPLFWPLLPMLYLGPVTRLGTSIYRKVADSRTCSITGKTLLPVNERSPRSARLVPVILVGGFFILANLYFGAQKIGNAWPAACYPTFDALMGDQTNTLSIVAVDRRGTSRSLGVGEFVGRLPSYRFRELMDRVLLTWDEKKRSSRLRAVWEVWRQADPTLRDVASVQFYRDTVWTDPERRSENPASRELLLAFQPPASRVAVTPGMAATH